MSAGVLDVGVSVAIRIRPFNQREIKMGELETVIAVEGNSVISKTSPVNQFHFGKYTQKKRSI